MEWRKQHKGVRVTRLLLALLLSVALLPSGVMADTEEEGQTQEAPPATVVSPEESGETTDEAEQNGTSEEEATAGETNTGSPSEANGNATPTQTTAPTTTSTPKPVRTSKSFRWSGVNLASKTAVRVEEPLATNASPTRAWVTGQASSMKLSWGKARSLSAIDGYILFRRDGAGTTYHEIAKVGKNTTVYTDKKASKKNVAYTYTIVGYKKVGSGIRISPCTPWVSGVTTKSARKNGYNAIPNKRAAALQVGQKVTLTLRYYHPASIHWGSSFRWYSDNTKVVTVNSKTGVITAVGPGTTTIRGRLASGRDMPIKVTVAGAFKPATPKLTLDYATESSVVLTWGKTKHTTSYDLYISADNGATYTKVNLKGTSYTHKNLVKGKEYRYYLQARNDNRGYTALSAKSNGLTQKAVATPRRSAITGMPAKASPKARSAYAVTVKIKEPAGRKAQVQMYENKKWVTKKAITLPAGYGTKSVKITLPGTWWTKAASSWRITVAGNAKATAATSSTLKITPRRYYQTPAGRAQIQNSIPKRKTTYNLSVGISGYKVWLVQRKLGCFSGATQGYTYTTAAYVRNFQRRHGLPATGVVNLATWKKLGYSENQWYYTDSYVSPLRVNPASTRRDHIEAMIATAMSYQGRTPYVWCASAGPGQGVDCTGLVMQALYGAGIDPLPIGSHVYALPKYEYSSALIWHNPRFMHVGFGARQRGDILCYYGHVAIYLGNNRMIEATPGYKVRITGVRTGGLRGLIRPFP